MIKGQQQNLQNFCFTQYPSGYLVKARKTLNFQYLWIDNQQGVIYELDSTNSIKHKIIFTKAQYQVSVFIGILQANENSYILLCENCQMVAQIENQMFYKILDVKILTLGEVKDNKHDLNIIHQITSLLSSGFYFCSDGDITLNLQDIQKKTERKSMFFWNERISSFIYDLNLNPLWIHPICQGFIQSFEIEGNDQINKFILISRRSKEKAGTRFNSRGIDDSGNVANFVETEQIVLNSNNITSFISIRGSVPTFWNQNGVGRSPKVTRTTDLTLPAFIKHFKFLHQNYGTIHCINLLGQKTASLNNSYEALIGESKLDYIYYEIFDFYQEYKRKDFGKINSIMTKTLNTVKQMKFYFYDLYRNEQLSTQTGVFRINCVDCLDRTNLYQSRICFAYMAQQFNLRGFIKQQTYEEQINQFDSTDQSQNKFISLYKHIWANNGDELSKLYAGTDATTSQLTREGKSTLFGKFQHGVATVKRLYKSKFQDDSKHLAIKALLEKSTQKSELEEQLEIEFMRYCDLDKIKLVSLTWNVFCTSASSLTSDDFERIFSFEEKFWEPNLIVIGLQEITHINAKNVMINTEKYGNEWDQYFLSNLNKIGEYVKVESHTLVGLYLLILAKKSETSRISKIIVNSYNTGFKGTFGNKGAISLSLYYDDSEIIIYNCHLSSGQEVGDRKKRKEELKNILSKSFSSQNQNVKNRIVQPNEADYRILLGDLNLRTDAPQDLTIELIKQYYALEDPEKKIQTFNKIREFDEIHMIKNLLQNFIECEISFMPTYKFKIGEDVYNKKSGKCPSWCDRILFGAQVGLIVQNIKYTSLDCRVSDHRPVVCFSILEIKKIDEKRLGEYRQELMQQMSDFKQNLNEESKQQDSTLYQNFKQK